MRTLENYYNSTLEEDISTLLNNEKTTAMWRKLLHSYLTRRKLIIIK